MINIIVANNLITVVLVILKMGEIIVKTDVIISKQFFVLCSSSVEEQQYTML